MITRNNIAHFYEKYKKNLSTEEQVIGGLLQAEDQEAWMDKLKQKSQTMRGLYIENEALLNLYVRPFLEREVDLTGDLADEFLHQIIEGGDDGFEDDLAFTQVAELLLAYYEEKKNLNGIIWCLNILGGIYNASSDPEEGKRSAECFKRLIDMRDCYFTIEDFGVRKRIIYALYNYPIVRLNFQIVNPEEIQQSMDDAMAFYTDPRVKELDGGQFDFPGLIEELIYDVLGNYIMISEKETVDPKLLERAKQALGDCYRQHLQENPNQYEMPDEVYCNYHRSLFLSGEIDCAEFIKLYKKFCDYIIEHDPLTELQQPDFSDTRLFQVAANHLPAILGTINHYSAEFQGVAEIRKSCVDQYMMIIRQLPRIGNTTFVNDVVCRSLCEFMELLSEEEVESQLLMNVMLNRNEEVMVHSSMVSQTARRILTSVAEKKPELLIGTLDCKSVVDVVEQQEKIADFIIQASKLFDVGMIELAQIANKQSRQLTEREKKQIYRHPEAGAKILNRIPILRRYQDIVLGHHKSWDGKMGYPESFDNTRSKDRFLIELIHVSDCLDAAMDFLGRSYKGQKDFSQCLQELSMGKGSLYCPELIDLIEEDTGLQSDLSYLLRAGRIRTCYEIYRGFVETSTPETLSLDQNAWDNQAAEDADDQYQLINILHESGNESRDFVRAMARNSLLILYVNMLSGTYKVFYRGNQRLFKYIPDGQYRVLLKDYFEPAAMPEDWKKVRYAIRLQELSHTLITQGGSCECELRMKISGNYRWVRLQFLQVDEENAIPKTMAVIIKDIQEIHNRSDQIAAVLKEAYQSAMEANKAKSFFLSNMSHDIRTPMNGIIGMTQIAMQHLNDPARVADCLKKINESSQHLLGLINEVLDMSRIESGKMTLNSETVSISQMITAVADVCRPDAQRRSQELQLQITDIDNDLVTADAVRLRQIMINLVSNAVKYTQNGGHIMVSAKQLPVKQRECGNYQFVVKDNGIGMSEEFQKTLFEPFAREDTSMTNATQGTGLGLSIVKSVITMMNGTIDVESKQGQGTTFTVTLQLPFASEKYLEEEKEDEQTVRRFDGHRILLTEDNELNREIACALMEEETGITVDTAVNGKEAIERLKEKPEGYYELIFMDIQMPIMNGYEAARAIRAMDSDYFRQVPIIAMTANVFQGDIMKAIESGMNEHITKPIDMNVVCKVLARWLKGEKSAEQQLV